MYFKIYLILTTISLISLIIYTRYLYYLDKYNIDLTDKQNGRLSADFRNFIKECNIKDLVKGFRNWDRVFVSLIISVIVIIYFLNILIFMVWLLYKLAMKIDKKLKDQAKFVGFKLRKKVRKYGKKNSKGESGKSKVRG